MAVLHGTVLDVGLYSTPAGPKTTAGAKEVAACIVDVSWTGTYVQADGVDIATTVVPLAIQAARRDGRTVTILGAWAMAPGVTSGVDGPLINAKTVTISGSTLAMKLTKDDCTTEYTNATSLGTLSEGVKLMVQYVATPI